MNAKHPIDSTKEGIQNITCWSEIHSLNAFFPIETTEEGIVISSSFGFFSKQLLQIFIPLVDNNILIISKFPLSAAICNEDVLNDNVKFYLNYQHKFYLIINFEFY